MILNPYILKEGESVRQLFLQIPHLNSEEAWTPNVIRPTRVISLDILPEKDTINILLGCPDWDKRGLANYVEVICSNLRMLIKAFGLIKDKMNIRWFEIDHTTSHVHFKSINFEKDNGTWLSEPHWTELLADQLPFNVSHYLILPQHKSET
ncbi:MAG: hypothetical protein ACRYGR_05640 [Janthinobacterium lividum]